jgi:hypothetical protein
LYSASAFGHSRHFDGMLITSGRPEHQRTGLVGPVGAKPRHRGKESRPDAAIPKLDDRKSGDLKWLRLSTISLEAEAIEVDAFSCLIWLKFFKKQEL